MLEGAADLYLQKPKLLLCRIFRVLGLPSAASWPTLEHLPHWRDNTENVRAQKPEFPVKSRLAEVIAEYR